MVTQVITAATTSGNFFQRLLDAAIPFGKYQLHWLELIGVLIGVVSAWYGMKRRVWAWPVGMVANVMLFFVYIGAAFGADSRIPLFGQSGRQVFLFATSVYGWWAWNRFRRSGAAVGDNAVNPRWATNRERLALAGLWLVGTVVAHEVFVALSNAAPNPFYTPQWWYFWGDAWIFVGSMAATYAMARGWNEFWLAWIAVDLIGVPLGFATGYVPTSVMYIFYGAFVIYGFTQWVKVTRESKGIPDRAPAAANA
jgi:nicotinamide mononucleotide transporter